MSLIGGKRKVNKSLKAWVAFVKKVQKEEKLSYKDAIHRAKVRKDKGEKWMMGGNMEDIVEEELVAQGPVEEEEEEEMMEGGRRRRTMRRRRGSRRMRRTMRRRRGSRRR
jgi:hypothetical protein